MTAPAELSNEQREVLQEITNVGMGEAGAAIASVLGEFVLLSVPSVVVLPWRRVAPTLLRSVSDPDVDAVRQAFHGDLRGDALVLFPPSGCTDLAALMGYDSAADGVTRDALLREIGGVLVGACLGSIATQLDVDVHIAAPESIARRGGLAALFEAPRAPSTGALLVDVDFRLERRNFTAQLAILMPGDDLATIGRVVDRLLAALA